MARRLGAKATAKHSMHKLTIVYSAARLVIHAHAARDYTVCSQVQAIVAFATQATWATIVATASAHVWQCDQPIVNGRLVDHGECEMFFR